jgi:hypothetical protein
MPSRRYIDDDGFIENGRGKEINMYCPECKCEYEGWSGECPVCKAALVAASTTIVENSGGSTPYDALVKLVRDNGGRLDFELTTVEVGRERKWSFPYFGFGYAWAKRMKGVSRDIAVDLATIDVGKDRIRRFPYLGYGFAWRREMRGHVGGNEVRLQARKVARRKTRSFPYFGYGRAWTELMVGECGDRLEAELQTVEVLRKKDWRFPYQGYGFAWAGKAMLTLKCIE